MCRHPVHGKREPAGHLHSHKAGNIQSRVAFYGALKLQFSRDLLANVPQRTVKGFKVTATTLKIDLSLVLDEVHSTLLLHSEQKVIDMQAACISFNKL